MPKAKRRKPPKRSAKPPKRADKPRIGRPPHEPTPQTRGQVAKMVLANIAQDMIARCIGVHEETLRTHYRKELDHSYALILSEIVGNVVTVARNANHRDFAKMAQFYLETHGWIRSERLVIPGISDEDDPANLSDTAIAERIARLRRAATARNAATSEAVQK